MDQFIDTGESEERTTEDINKEETEAYELDDDVNDDQAPKEEENNTGVTLNVDNRLKPSIEEPLSLELKISPDHLEKLNDNTMKDHFRLPLIDQILESWEKCHYMVPEGILLGHRISRKGIEVDKAKIAKPLTKLLPKDGSFDFDQACMSAFKTLKDKLVQAPIMIALDWDLPFELMYDASDFAVRAVLGQQKDKHFHPIYYSISSEDVYHYLRDVIFSDIVTQD
ncbi:uncharacterized protein LOC120281156 [Dioscorea cayenensis subsp. rotundata]|uniref:Uncharacterized protein LOC120281156 n=1 Tax=Dioscorea cayennensis subsp. rotundata TaxID=55577 RepID=A0AB40CVF0_DIOCR|nr:uncharacterized protein LOC120281156 [Dioscorea cayenensis subsp. rotundata]